LLLPLFSLKSGIAMTTDIKEYMVCLEGSQYSRKYKNSPFEGGVRGMFLPPFEESAPPGLQGWHFSSQTPVQLWVSQMPWPYHKQVLNSV